MKKRTYVPKIEEFKKGFEYLVKLNSGRWDKLVFEPDTHNFIHSFKSESFFIKEKNVRVKYLDRADLEELGFTVTEESITKHGHHMTGWIKTKNRKTELWYSFLHSKPNIYIVLKTSHFNGNCRVSIKNKSEFKLLLQQCNII